MRFSPGVRRGDGNGQEVESLLNKLPDDCSLEDIQYHLYVIEKVRHGLATADNQGTLTQDEAGRELRK
jgi:hypothetical protein